MHPFPESKQNAPAHVNELEKKILQTMSCIEAKIGLSLPTTTGHWDATRKVVVVEKEKENRNKISTEPPKFRTAGPNELRKCLFVVKS